jgi:hypothetical protein
MLTSNENDRNYSLSTRDQQAANLRFRALLLVITCSEPHDQTRWSTL